MAGEVEEDWMVPLLAEEEWDRLIGWQLGASKKLEIRRINITINTTIQSKIKTFLRKEEHIARLPKMGTKERSNEIIVEYNSLL